MRKTKLIIIIFVLSLFVLSSLLLVYFNFLHKYQGKMVIYEWQESDYFDIFDIATLEKKPNQEFIILNLADIQMCDLEDLTKLPLIHQEIDELVTTIKPDLITLTGDQTWSNENLISLKTLIHWLDGYKIPYAPIFGNHDLGNVGDVAVAGENYCADLYEASTYCLFKRGPSNLGALGNYVVNILEDGKLYKTLYFMAAGVNDVITDEQIAWFKWNASGIKAYYGTSASAMCFMHKPIPEYLDAYLAYLKGDASADNQVYVTFSLSGTKQNGFYQIAKACGVSDFVCGHQHGNNFTINFDDCSFTFALKTGELVSYYGDQDIYLNGATYFRLGENVKVNNYYVDYKKYHLNDKYNIWEK